MLTTYAAETAVDREVPNPAVKVATAELKRLRSVAQKLRAALGRALVLDTDQPPTADRPGSKARRTPHLAPTARAALMSQVQTLEVQLDEINGLGLPVKDDLAGGGPTLTSRILMTSLDCSGPNLRPKRS